MAGMNVPNAVNKPSTRDFNRPVIYHNQHTIYSTVSGRISLVTANPIPGQTSMTRLSGTQNNHGDTIFLKYFDNQITSIRLPCPAPAGVGLFITDNMSGCKFYVDEISGSHDLVVFHANTHSYTAGPVADADFQRPEANNVLDTLHADAQRDYAPLNLNNIATCAMPKYFALAARAERHKRAMGRQSTQPHPQPGEGPKFLGGCTIVGFPQGNTWEFWYQTWGDVSYRRPELGVARALFTGHWNYLRKKAGEGSEHQADYSTMKVIDCQKI